MTKLTRTQQTLAPTQATVRREYLAAEQVTVLPEREALSLVNANVAAPINAALSLNVLSDGAVAYANAQQYAPITQGI